MENLKHKIQNLGRCLNFILSFYILIFSFLILAPRGVLAATNIDSIDRWAWNDVIGWIDFYSTDTVLVGVGQLKGYATSAVGFISLDCQTGPPGSTCLPVGYLVTNVSGTLAGWAWSENIGWISFNCNNDSDPLTAGVQSYCAAADHRVIIDAVGEFSGWAWNDLVGWISFNKSNCDIDNNGFVDAGLCGGDNSTVAAVSYRVRTTALSGSFDAELESGIFDSGIVGGAAWNSILWQGALPFPPTTEEVKFQVASGNDPAGPWDYLGDDGTTASFYGPSPGGLPLILHPADHHNKRYLRYKIFLKGSLAGSPVVEDVIINWSP